VGGRTRSVFPMTALVLPWTSRGCNVLQSNRAFVFSLLMAWFVTLSMYSVFYLLLYDTLNFQHGIKACSSTEYLLEHELAV
jgi:hypothetical protein